MKSIMFIALFALGGALLPNPIKPQSQGSFVQFKVSNFGFGVTGSFTGLEGDIQFDPQKVINGVFNVSIDANTVNTDNGMRDGHLRNADYFDVKKYPRITFNSTKVEFSTKKGTYFVTGKLGIKNHTKIISFPFTVVPADGGQLFKGSFTINRRDFEVGGYSTISDDVEISLSVLAK